MQSTPSILCNVLCVRRGDTKVRGMEAVLTCLVGVFVTTFEGRIDSPGILVWDGPQTILLLGRFLSTHIHDTIYCTGRFSPPTAALQGSTAWATDVAFDFRVLPGEQEINLTVRIQSPKHQLPTIPSVVRPYTRLSIAQNRALADNYVDEHYLADVSYFHHEQQMWPPLQVSINDTPLTHHMEQDARFKRTRSRPNQYDDRLLFKSVGLGKVAFVVSGIRVQKAITGQPGSLSACLDLEDNGGDSIVVDHLVKSLGMTLVAWNGRIVRRSTRNLSAV
ncbi:hypothetical protein DL95DRAFT_152469 [Leptodontidium sp. 2 PMI_412]|nr:hypothetical protein DL95DRAFT_152469 [Leptodontidium sp. 2 PMI_412]